MGKGERLRRERQTVAVGTGITIDTGKKFHNKPIADPGEGKHLWTCVASWKIIDPTAESFTLDTENLLSIDGPGCFKCESVYSPELAAQPCGGSVL